MPRGRSPNQHSPGRVDGLSPAAMREVQNLYDRVNYLTQEVEVLRALIPSEVSKAAMKENPTAGIITIPSPGQDGFIRVNKDGVIKSYGSPPLGSVGMARTIELNTDVVGNVGAGTDALHSYTLKAGTLARDGDFLRVFYAGSVANNDTDKGLAVLFDGQTVDDNGSRDLDDGFNVGWVITVYYVRLAATSVRAVAIAMAGFLIADSTPALVASSGSYYLPVNSVITVSNLDTTSVVMLVTGSSAAGTTDDITQNLSIIDLVRMS